MSSHTKYTRDFSYLVSIAAALKIHLRILRQSNSYVTFVISPVRITSRSISKS